MRGNRPSEIFQISGKAYVYREITKELKHYDYEDIVSSTITPVLYLSSFSPFCKLYWAIVLFILERFSVNVEYIIGCNRGYKWLYSNDNVSDEKSQSFHKWF